MWVKVEFDLEKNMLIQNWTEVVVSSLQNAWAIVASFIPDLIGALIVLIVGLIVAAGLGKVVEKVFEALRLDTLLTKLELSSFFERAGLHLRGAYFLGQLVYWFVLISFLLAIFDILGLSTLGSFVQDILSYIPNVVAAIIIMLIAVVVANFLRKLVLVSTKGAKLEASNFLGALTWWAVVIFGFLAALTQLNIAVNLINTIVAGFIAMLALGGGLAFGLGGKDYASYLVNKLREHTESKR